MNVKAYNAKPWEIPMLLDGKKTATRRLIKPQHFIGLLPDKCKNGTPEEFLKEKKYMFKPYCDMTDAELINTAYKPPYNSGDILYVKKANIWLKVKDIRVEQLQDRGNDWCLDIKKEGIVTPQDPIFYSSDDKYHDALREEIKKLWNSTIKKPDLDRYGWDANPWVWTIEYEKIEKPYNYEETQTEEPHHNMTI